MKKLKFLETILAVWCFLEIQANSSQTIDSMRVSLAQTHGNEKAMLVRIDQSLSQLRAALIKKGINVSPDDDLQTKNCEREGQAEQEKLGAKMQLFIPPLAQGYEKVYENFFNGLLLYKPKRGRDDEIIKLPIRSLSNPLEGTFDLSLFGDMGKYLSISTGYRKGKKPENASKVEIWIVPRFLVERELNTTAAHFKPIIDKWWEQEKAPVGLFWTNGGWDDLSWYDYLTTQSMAEISNNNLYEKSRIANGCWGGQPGCAAMVEGGWGYWGRDGPPISSFTLDLRGTEE